MPYLSRPNLLEEISIWFTTFISLMKIVIDHKIPFIRGVFEPYAQVLYLPGPEISNEHLRDTDCLLVRTRTQCNQRLLEGTRVKFIGTATIGFDHIDAGWCEQNGIKWTNAPGCNSESVAQYITSALLIVAQRGNFDITTKTLGIIGVGNVGTKVEKIARELGMPVILNDPPRERAEGGTSFMDLTALLRNSDIISVHVPLNREGPDKTHHMVDGEFLQNMKTGAILINSSRGEVLDEKAVLQFLADRRLQIPIKPNASTLINNLSLATGHLSLVLDVWENEPDINRELLGIAEIATPHIAGYSMDGKWNATKMMINAVAKEFSLDPGDPASPLVAEYLRINEDQRSGMRIRDCILATCDIQADDRRLRESPGSFEELRNNYPVRREFHAYTIDPFPGGEDGEILARLGFKHI